MRKIYLLILLGMIVPSSFAQLPATFNGNQIETTISNGNSLFWNPATNKAAPV